MSRLVVYGIDNYSEGEFTANLSRGWTVEGSRSVAGGGQSTVSVERDIALKSWLGPGKILRAAHFKLPAWAGMIDTPWGATLPVRLTIYNQAYLMSIRTPDTDDVIEGDVYEIAAQVIQRINAAQMLYVRLGTVSGEDQPRRETFKGGSASYWDQLRAVVIRADKQMFLRPEHEHGQLITYVDIMDRVGTDTGFLLHDGKGANIKIMDATVDGKIINMLTGLGSQSTGPSRMTSGAQIDQASADLFRLRSGVIQYPNVVQDDILLRNTLSDLTYAAWPKIRIPVQVLDVGDTLKMVRPGNSYILHVGEIYLPFGVQGWRGKATMTGLAYDEDTETVGGMFEVTYAPV